ncbi:DUF5360 family protein [Sulfitobacter pacificus]|uniref:DUF5360 family protein n=1 Tax=Sulfitobacter pacificus TaxID=1499314 RepID=UPI00360E3927
MKIALTVTEVGMLIYWGFASVVVLGWVIVAPDAMYPYYRNPLIVIWNWSFLPIDILFALCGLAARFVPMAPERAVVLQIVSLTLMFCAGLMALNFGSCNVGSTLHGGRSTRGWSFCLLPGCCVSFALPKGLWHEPEKPTHQRQ